MNPHPRVGTRIDHQTETSVEGRDNTPSSSVVGVFAKDFETAWDKDRANLFLRVDTCTHQRTGTAHKKHCLVTCHLRVGKTPLELRRNSLRIQ